MQPWGRPEIPDPTILVEKPLGFEIRMPRGWSNPPQEFHAAYAEKSLVLANAEPVAPQQINVAKLGS